MENQPFQKIAALSWRAYEHNHIPKGYGWYFVTGTILAAIIAYAIITESPIMAITFILIGIVGFIVSRREPKEIEFRINADGIHAGRELYPFENIKSFWIFYEPPERKIISIHTVGDLVPFVHIPLGDTDPSTVRHALLTHIPEKKHIARFIDTLEKFL